MYQNCYMYLNYFFDGNLLNHIDFLKIDVFERGELFLKAIHRDVFDSIKKIGLNVQ